MHIRHTLREILVTCTYCGFSSRTLSKGAFRHGLEIQSVFIATSHPIRENCPKISSGKL